MGTDFLAFFKGKERKVVTIVLRQRFADNLPILILHLLSSWQH
jgi:hypothetical protein